MALRAGVARIIENDQYILKLRQCNTGIGANKAGAASNINLFMKFD
jgi:hypothetical protein